MACLRILAVVINYQRDHQRLSSSSLGPAAQANPAFLAPDLPLEPLPAAKRPANKPAAQGVARLKVLNRVEGENTSPGGAPRARIVGPGFQSQAAKPPTASPAEAHLIELLGAMVRSLCQHRNHTAASVNAVLEVLIDSNAAGSASTIAGSDMTCPEALAVVFAVLRGCEENDRMNGLIQLSVLLKTGPQNVNVWLRQPGWQLWLLDLVELEDENAVLVTAASGRSSRHQGGGVGGDPPPGCTTGSSAIAADILAVLLVAALEMDRGWRVWLPTMGCLRQRFGFVKSVNYHRGLATVASAVIARMGAQAVSSPPIFRVNVMRSLRIADSRLDGDCLARVTFAAVPVLKAFRNVSLLIDQELLLAVRLLVRSMVAMADAGRCAEQNALDPSPNLIQLDEDALTTVVSPNSGRVYGVLLALLFHVMVVACRSSRGLLWAFRAQARVFSRELAVERQLESSAKHP